MNDGAGGRSLSLQDIPDDYGSIRQPETTLLFT